MSVSPDQPDPFSTIDVERQVVEQILPAEGFSNSR